MPFSGAWNLSLNLPNKTKQNSRHATEKKGKGGGGHEGSL